MITYLDAILSLAPDAQCVVCDDEIKQWYDKRPQPTQAEIDAEMLRLQTEYDANEYQRLRVYPPLEDFADAYVKMRSLDPVVAAAGQVDMNVYVDTCLQIKIDNPKGGA